LVNGGEKKVSFIRKQDQSHCLASKEKGARSQEQAPDVIEGVWKET
jgi:hypothetical protein